MGQTDGRIALFQNAPIRASLGIINHGRCAVYPLVGSSEGELRRQRHGDRSFVSIFSAIHHRDVDNQLVVGDASTDPQLVTVVLVSVRRQPDNRRPQTPPPAAVAIWRLL